MTGFTEQDFTSFNSENSDAGYELQYSGEFSSFLEEIGVESLNTTDTVFSDLLSKVDTSGLGEDGVVDLADVEQAYNPNAVNSGDPNAVNSNDPNAVNSNDPNAVNSGDPNAVFQEEMQAAQDTFQQEMQASQEKFQTAMQEATNSGDGDQGQQQDTQQQQQDTQQQQQDTQQQQQGTQQQQQQGTQQQNGGVDNEAMQAAQETFQEEMQAAQEKFQAAMQAAQEKFQAAQQAQQEQQQQEQQQPQQPQQQPQQSQQQPQQEQQQSQQQPQQEQQQSQQGDGGSVHDSQGMAGGGTGTGSTVHTVHDEQNMGGVGTGSTGSTVHTGHDNQGMGGSTNPGNEEGNYLVVEGYLTADEIANSESTLGYSGYSEQENTDFRDFFVGLGIDVASNNQGQGSDGFGEQGYSEDNNKNQKAMAILLAGALNQTKPGTVTGVGGAPAPVDMSEALTTLGASGVTPGVAQEATNRVIAFSNQHNDADMIHGGSSLEDPNFQVAHALHTGTVTSNNPYVLTDSNGQKFSATTPAGQGYGGNGQRFDNAFFTP
jgi:hypothetical protein